MENQQEIKIKIDKLMDEIEKSENVKVAEQKLNEIRSLKNVLQEDAQKQKAIAKAKEEANEIITTITDDEQNEIRGLDFSFSDGVKNVGKFTTEKRKTRDFENEYRQAFKDYIQKGIPITEELKQYALKQNETRANEFSSTQDLGAFIPQTVLKGIYNADCSTYGYIYNQVRKTLIKGGLQLRVSDLNGEFSWVNTEGECTDRQKVGEGKMISFSYYYAEIKLGISLLADIVTIEEFESELIKVILKAFYKFMDKAIVSGTGQNQMTGLTATQNVQSISVTPRDLESWVTFNNILAQYECSETGAQWIFANKTFRKYLTSLRDDMSRPLMHFFLSEKEKEKLYFMGMPLIRVETDIIKDVDSANVGDVIGIIWKPDDYLLNYNQSLLLRKYEDWDCNQTVFKGLFVADGKYINPKSCLLIKKGNDAVGGHKAK